MSRKLPSGISVSGIQADQGCSSGRVVVDDYADNVRATALPGAHFPALSLPLQATTTTESYTLTRPDALTISTGTVRRNDKPAGPRRRACCPSSGGWRFVRPPRHHRHCQRQQCRRRAGGGLAGFDFGDAARMAAEFATQLGRAPAGQRGW